MAHEPLAEHGANARQGSGLLAPPPAARSLAAALEPRHPREDVADGPHLAHRTLGKADELIGFLNMQSPVISKVVLRLKENLNNRDSIRVLINELQEKISKHYVDNHNDIVSSYVLVGMLTEGLYLSLNACKNPNRKSISYMVNEFNQTLLQQKAFLMNLKEMLKNTGLQTDPDLFKNLDDLSRGFQDLGITYSVDVKKKFLHALPDFFVG